MRPFLQLLALIAVTGSTCGCLRLAAPPQLSEAVQVTIDRNEARLATAQDALLRQVEPRLQRELNWRVSPTGTSRLKLWLNRENIDDSAVGNLGVPSRWRIAISGTWQLETTRWGTLTGQFRGTGSANDLDGEPAALLQAASAASNQIIAGLDSKLTERQRAPALKPPADQPEPTTTDLDADDRDQRRPND
jgi:hypothetical protein